MFAVDLPLERVFSSPALSWPTPRHAKLSPDGRFVTPLKNRVEDKDRYHLWVIDKPIEMMVYPGATHRIAGEGPQTHVWTTITRFLDEKLLKQPWLAA